MRYGGRWSGGVPAPLDARGLLREREVRQIALRDQRIRARRLGRLGRRASLLGELHREFWTRLWPVDELPLMEGEKCGGFVARLPNGTVSSMECRVVAYSASRTTYHVTAVSDAQHPSPYGARRLNWCGIAMLVL